MPFITARTDGSLFGVFRRNIVVVDADLVVDKDQTTGEPSFSLRGRDLRYAKLDRTDLHQVDLTGADLDEASLIGTDLRGAWLQCADVTELLLTEDRETARCTSAKRTNFTRARLNEAHMSGVDLRGAKLEEAQLEAAEISYSLLTGADFSSARLDKADLTGGVAAQGAQFLIASLQGADLTGAQLQAADFASASLQGAVLNYAHLQGVVLRDAELDAASFLQARMDAADMTGAKLSGADFRGAGVWLAKPPEPDGAGVADFGNLYVKPPSEADIGALRRMLEGFTNRRVRTQVTDALASLLDPKQSAAWETNQDYAKWQGLAAAPVLGPADVDTFSTRLTEHLARLMCRSRWSNGAIATGVARRAQIQQFRGNLVALYDKLKAEDCPASKTVLPKVLKEFSAAADVARSN
jgi:uncharacterized protein YjbI with pentapeptide repeats